MTEISDAEIEIALSDAVGADVAWQARIAMRLYASAGEAILALIVDATEDEKARLIWMTEFAKRFVARDPVEIEHAKGGAVPAHPPAKRQR